MADARVELTSVTSLRAEAVGEPGQRTFRILVDGGSSSMVIWLEKEQLFQLGLAARQMLSTLPAAQGSSGAPSGKGGTPPPAHMEFKLGKLALGHERASGRFVFDAHDEESSEGDAPTLRIWGERAQVKALADEALRVCAAGRPLCPICGNPMDSTGHSCSRTNGHQAIDLADL